MQQTDKYKLNKPGVDDPIAIAPLNENMDKLEAAITAEAAFRQSETAGLNQRVTVLEAHKVRMAIGTFAGNGSAMGDVQLIQVGFTPKVVILLNNNLNQTYIATAEAPYVTYSVPVLEIVDGGFQVVRESHSNTNTITYNFAYAAFA